MKISTEVSINGSAEDIWSVITNIEHAAGHISGIEHVQVHHQPEDGVVGLKWTETRTLFGKTATETMWITEAEPNHYYKTRAESHGAIYTTILQIIKGDDGNRLRMEFGSEAQTMGAKIMSVLMGGLFKNATRKALLKDLQDIKAAVENK